MSSSSEDVINGDESKKKDGALLALSTFGRQDAWMARLKPEALDARIKFLTDGVHHCVYRKIATQKTMSPEKKILKFTFQRECDLVNHIDLYVPYLSSEEEFPFFNGQDRKLFDLVKSVKVEFGGQRVDSFNHQQQYDISCAAFSRTPGHFGSASIFPLVMAPFHSWNLCVPSAAYHDLVVYIEFREDFNRDLTKVELYGKSYFLEQGKRNVLFGQAHEFMTIQTSAMEIMEPCGLIRKGTNRVNVNFLNHPTYMQFFWGFDKSKVTRIVYELNDCVYYDGPIEPLEYRKIKRGYGDCEAVIIFFGDDRFNAIPRSTVNFSRVDNATLTIETLQEKETRVFVGGLNVQGYRTMSGMVGLVFSK